MGPLNSAVFLITGGQERDHDPTDHCIKSYYPLKTSKTDSMAGKRL